MLAILNHADCASADTGCFSHFVLADVTLFTESVDIVGIIQIFQNINSSHVIGKAFLTSTILSKELSYNMDTNQWQACRIF